MTETSDADPFLASVHAGAAIVGEEIIDVHGHCADNLVPPPPGTPAWPRSSATLLDAMDRVGTRHLVFSHFDALQAMRPADYENAARATAAIVDRHPDRLSAYVVLHPHLPGATTALLEGLPMENPMCADSQVLGSSPASDHGSRLDQSQAGSIGSPRSHPVYVGAKFHGELFDCRLGDRVMQPWFERCEALHFGVLVHLHPGETARDVSATAARFPRLNFILAHLWPRLPEAAALFADHTNLFVDTSLSASRPQAIERLIAAVGARRIAYGSDSCYLAMGGQIAKVACSAIGPEAKRILFSGTARAALPLLAARFR